MAGIIESMAGREIRASLSVDLCNSLDADFCDSFELLEIEGSSSIEVISIEGLF
jgi:hypothetical protein